MQRSGIPLVVFANVAEPFGGGGCLWRDDCGGDGGIGPRISHAWGGPEEMDLSRIYFGNKAFCPGFSF